MTDKQQPKVFVAMSGGVDSSVAAALLKDAGYEVVGVSMHLWCEEKQGAGTQRRPCCSTEDIRDAQEVCRRLDIPHYVFNFEKEFKEYVVDYFVREYSHGRTPNPCLACNQHIKFHFLLNRILSLGSQYLATGHYARTVSAPDGFRLLKARDESKDQSYVLFTLGQEQLKHVLFPLGDYTKAQVRRIAEEKGLPVATKPDSQEICFVPGRNYASFITQRTKCVRGNIVDVNGRVLGTHPGVACYSIGQRHGLGLTSPHPLYVKCINAISSTIVVSEEKDLYTSTLHASHLNWVSGHPPLTPVEVTAKVRYKSPSAPATLFPEGENVRLEFHQPQRAITPGQAVVFYHDEIVLGGGIIDASEACGKIGVPVRESVKLLPVEAKC
jgi:tRNA-specific 2-thiouridylase